MTDFPENAIGITRVYDDGKPGFRTDKIFHGYLPTYLKIAGEIGIQGAVVELGVQGGESLSMWQALFPSGKVVGVDLEESSTWPEGTVRIVSDQCHPELPSRIVLLSGVQKFDLIVDDAGHQGVQTRRSWDLLWSLVKPGGFYVIEDWDIGIKGNPYHVSFGRSMLDMAEGFLSLLKWPGAADIDSIEYKCGLIILRKTHKK